MKLKSYLFKPLLLISYEKVTYTDQTYHYESVISSYVV